LPNAHERLANARGGFQHNVSGQLIDENKGAGLPAVVVETLKVKNLMKNQPEAGEAYC